MSSLRLSICWSTPRNGVAEELADFFVANVDPEYISHQEMQGGRALSANQWDSDLRSSLVKEVLEIWTTVATAECSRGIVEARIGGTLVGMAIMSWYMSAKVPYSWGEDLVVLRSSRGKKIGLQMVEWILQELRNKGIRRVFLESGVGNDHAHRYFEQVGFSTCSIVMMKSLDANDA